MDGSAVDTKGVRHTFTVKNEKAPWVVDEIKSVKPFYPLSARAYQHQGRGLVRLILDPATGTMTAAGMVKSTGYQELDDAALVAMRQCRWKAGTWKEVDLPVSFQLYSYPDNARIKPSS